MADITVNGSPTNPPNGTYSMYIGDTFTAICSGDSSGSYTTSVIVDSGPSGYTWSGGVDRTYTYTAREAGTYTFKFIGMRTNDHTGYSSVEGSGTVTLNVTAIPIVSIDFNGGSYDNISQQVTSIYLPSSGGTYTGHSFLGWSTNKNATSATYSPGAQVTPTSDTTYYAVWEMERYTISFIGADEEVISSDTYEFGSTVTCPDYENPPNNTVFLGWGEEFIMADEMSPVIHKAEDIFTAEEAVTYYAVLRNKYTVSCPSSDYSVTGYAGDLYVLPVVTENPYLFLGWVDDEGNFAQSDAVRYISKDLTYTRVWKEIRTITFVWDSGDTESLQLEGYGYVTLPYRISEGRALMGWKSGSEIYAPFDTLYLSEDTTFTAVWDIRTTSVNPVASDTVYVRKDGKWVVAQSHNGTVRPISRN